MKSTMTDRVMVVGGGGGGCDGLGRGFGGAGILRRPKRSGSEPNAEIPLARVLIHPHMGEARARAAHAWVRPPTPLRHRRHTRHPGAFHMRRCRRIILLLRGGAAARRHLRVRPDVHGGAAAAAGPGGGTAGGDVSLVGPVGARDLGVHAAGRYSARGCGCGGGGGGVVVEPWD
ncbi:hypothetical protein TIFTF001_025443 [Ficus carica]|uniref:Uncharacterized protein n=1 Tax=Ficus carica TaxID=3494 RepID=A0AA88AYU2_FICCA|nr:hypothetical protein TIFTF001_025443 [Ficus carica]